MDACRPHVTLVTKEELAACTVNRQELLQNFQLLSSSACFPAGIAVTAVAGEPHSTTAALSQSSLQPKDLLNMTGLESSTALTTDAEMQLSSGKPKQTVPCL